MAFTSDPKGAGTVDFPSSPCTGMTLGPTSLTFNPEGAGASAQTPKAHHDLPT